MNTPNTSLAYQKLDKEHLDAIDSAIFNSDILHNKDNLLELEFLFYRWIKALSMISFNEIDISQSTEEILKRIKEDKKDNPFIDLWNFINDDSFENACRKPK